MSSGPAPRASRVSRRGLGLLGALLALTLAGGGIAGATYARYAAEHLRKRPGLPRCAIAARVQLRKPATVSGTEPRDTLTGETVYLTPDQDKAVSCASTIDKDLSRQLAGALAEPDPARRAAALTTLVRDQAEAPRADLRTATAFMMASGALRSLPKELPEVKAANDEINRIYACRFDTKLQCPTRPPMPALVWITGVPAAGAALGLVGIGVATGAAALKEQRRRKREKAAAAATAAAAAAPATEQIDPPDPSDRSA